MCDDVVLVLSYATQLTSSQHKAFVALYNWRDAVARQEDESVHYVLPKKALIALATGLPTTVEHVNVRTDQGLACSQCVLNGPA